MKFLIASGGTGGHFYPGFALGLELRRRGHEVKFIVKKADISIRTLVKNKFEFAELDMAGLPRGWNPLRYGAFAWKFVKSFFQAWFAVGAFKPDACVGAGGYLSFQALFVAKLRGVKTAAHDSNARLGFANKLSSHFTDCFLLGLPTNERVKNAVLAGTPIREEFSRHFDRTKVFKDWGLNEDAAMVLIFGGSQGSKNLNITLSKTVKKILRKNKSVQFVHISGDKGYERLKKEYRGVAGVKLMPYCHEIYALMAVAELVVCRAGASTVAELYALKKPALLVPYPHAAANHQYYNALILKKAGSAELVSEEGDFEEKVSAALSSLTEDKNILDFMAGCYAHLELPNPITAARRIADILEKL